MDAAGAEHESERDERHVERDQADRLWEGVRGQGPGVRPFHGDDPRILAQGFGELGAPDVEGVDALGAALQQDIGKATGRRTDVEADAAARVDLERIEGSGKLVAATRDVRVPLDEIKRRRRIEEIAGLAVPSRSVPLADTHLAGQHERLRTGARLDQAALDEELVESDAGPLRRRRAHPAIVAQRPSPRLDWSGGGGPERPSCRRAPP